MALKDYTAYNGNGHPFLYALNCGIMLHIMDQTFA